MSKPTFGVGLLFGALLLSALPGISGVTGVGGRDREGAALSLAGSSLWTKAYDIDVQGNTPIAPSRTVSSSSIYPT